MDKVDLEGDGSAPSVGGEAYYLITLGNFDLSEAASRPLSFHDHVLSLIVFDECPS